MKQSWNLCGKPYTVNIWIPDYSGIWMVDLSTVVKWSCIQMVWKAGWKKPIYVMDSMFYWAGILACISLPSILSWIRPDTLIWKLALFQFCSPRIKDGRKRVKCGYFTKSASFDKSNHDTIFTRQKHSWLSTNDHSYPLDRISVKEKWGLAGTLVCLSLLS